MLLGGEFFLRQERFEQAEPSEEQRKEKIMIHIISNSIDILSHLPWKQRGEGKRIGS
jgi:hypothetical protein